MQPDAPWTLEQLSARVADATQRLGLLQSNGQVADAPNARAIRWYQSTGLVSRPQQRGRVAYYGPAHLFQLVAIKRLQASGKTLDDVQHDLLGKDDDAVRLLAAVPEDIAAAVTATVAVTVETTRSEARSFWSDDVADVDVAASPLPVSESEPVPDPAGRLALDHPCGVTLVFPSARTPTPEDVQAILSVVVDQLTARGLLAVIPKEKP
ncbi:MAG: MerR family transcriptional regulator [Deltaproteobacteria bacterium]|nr:MerR family transcriptional regulator [Deltaproteobacteria bacterium]